MPGQADPCPTFHAACLARSLLAVDSGTDTSCYDRDLAARLSELNADQRGAYDRIIASVEGSEGRLFLLDGPSGMGKTSLYDVIRCKLQREGNAVLYISSSGICGPLICDCRSAHSIFKIPIDHLDESQADLLQETNTIIWDHIGAQHHPAVEAVDRTLRTIRNVDHPFGGITVILGRDSPPTQQDIQVVDTTTQHSFLWPNIEVLHLKDTACLELDIGC